jgi:hypothetical protein
MTVPAPPAVETVHSVEMPPSSSGAPPLLDPPLLPVPPPEEPPLLAPPLLDPPPPELPELLPPLEPFELLHATKTAVGTRRAARKAR